VVTLKRFVRTAVRKRGYHLVFVSPGLPTGTALDIDLMRPELRDGLPFLAGGRVQSFWFRA
jgi:hypothetical protein